VSSTGRCRVPVAPITADKVPASPVDITTALQLRYPVEELPPGTTITGNDLYHQQLRPVTGFGLKLDSSGSFQNLAGLEMVFASDYTGWVPEDLGIAIKEMKAAYDDAMSRVSSLTFRRSMSESAKSVT
jgi:hypothetical protein